MKRKTHLHPTTLTELLRRRREQAAGVPAHGLPRSKPTSPENRMLAGMTEEDAELDAQIARDEKKVRGAIAHRRFFDKLLVRFVIGWLIVLGAFAYLKYGDQITGFVRVARDNGVAILNQWGRPGTTTVNGTPITDITATSTPQPGECRTIELTASGDGVAVNPDTFPTVLDQPSSWCPSDTALWNSMATDPRLAGDIAKASGLDDTWIPKIASALEASLTNGRLELPGKVETAPTEVPTEVAPPTGTPLAIPTDTPMPAEPTATPTPTPTMAPTAIVLINRNFRADQIGKFLADYGLSGLTSGPIDCEKVDLHAVKLYYANDLERYIVGDLSVLAPGFRTQGCTGITVLPYQSKSGPWTEVNGAWFSPFSF